MARVQGPNGLVFEFPDDVAKRLVDSPAGDHKYVEAEPKPGRAKPKSSKK